MKQKRGFEIQTQPKDIQFITEPFPFQFHTKISSLFFLPKTRNFDGLEKKYFLYIKNIISFIKKLTLHYVPLRSNRMPRHNGGGGRLNGG